MKIINDKEVGKFWKLVHETKDYPIVYEIAVPLIRKLVNEEYLRQLGCFDSQQQRQAIIKKDCQNEALKRYRIDPADWKDDD